MKDNTTVQDKFTFTITRTREIREGKVGIVYSPGFGAGWYTWNRMHDNCEQLIFDPQLVRLVDQGSPTETIMARAEELVPGGGFYAVEDLEVYWLDQGTKFLINEYDGSETIQLMETTPWLQA